MLIDKIKNWLQKRGYDIHAEVSPAIDFFGVIKFSLAKVTVDHTNPDEWSEDERKVITDILNRELNASLEEFSKCLKEERNELTKEEIESILDTIAELITEKPLIRLREFEERSEIKQLLEYKRFIGREEELKELHTFLADDSRKIMAVSGEGGTGKTRLALEFARQTEDKNWRGYFIHPNKPFKYFGALPSSGKILLILDDASRYPERDKLIDFVLNPPLDSDIKLLLIDRTIFKDRIESNLREKGVFVEAYEIKKGGIIPFLEEYFEIEENTAIEIERECQDSFVWAAFFAEFYREEGRVDELRKVLINRTEKYIRDLEIRATGMTIEDVKKVLSLLSLVTPVKWKEDKKYFEEIFEESLPEYEYEHLKRIISLAGETNILLVSDGEYAIKPDPVADFIRTDFIRDKRFNRLLNSLLPYMPFRISYNIGVIPRFKAEIEEVFTVLGNIIFPLLYCLQVILHMFPFLI
jgi:DNA polymerase III delta prime subunit